jgi:hypothetical protein
MRQLVMLSAQTDISVRSNDASANFQTLATGVGVLLAARNMDVKSSIASIIQAGMPDEAQTTPHPLGPPLNLPARDSAEINSNGGHDDVLELPRYTTALKEYGDRSGAVIEWSEKQLSLSPLCWVARVVVDGVTFEATAGNKKEAKHRASRSACRSLAIEI